MIYYYIPPLTNIIYQYTLLSEINRLNNSTGKIVVLTQRGQNIMADILQTTLSSTVTWETQFVFWCNFHWSLFEIYTSLLNHWGRVTHICINKQTVIGSENGLSSGRRQTIIWTNVGILLIGLWGTNFSEIWIEMYTFSFKKMHLEMSSGNWRPFCLGLFMYIV